MQQSLPQCEILQDIKNNIRRTFESKILTSDEHSQDKQMQASHEQQDIARQRSVKARAEKKRTNSKN